MAGNQNAPHGFEPIGTLHGGAMQTMEFVKLAAFGHAIYRNDIVHAATSDATNSEGRIAPALEGSDTFTPGTTLESGILLNYAPASTLSDHQVLIDPHLIMEGQDDGSVNPATVVLGVQPQDPGKNANITLATAGQTFGSAAGKQGLSGQQIDATTIATTNTLDLHILHLLYVNEALGGNAFGANSRVVVTFNRHRLANQVVGV